MPCSILAEQLYQTISQASTKPHLVKIFARQGSTTKQSGYNHGPFVIAGQLIRTTQLSLLRPSLNTVALRTEKLILPLWRYGDRSPRCFTQRPHRHARTRYRNSPANKTLVGQDPSPLPLRSCILEILDHPRQVKPFLYTSLQNQ